MKVSKKEILLIYNSGQLSDRKAFSYAKSMKNHEIREIDLLKNSLTETQLKQIINKLEIKPDELIDTESPKYLRYFSSTDLTPKSILKVLKQNPGMIKTPIALFYDHAVFVKSPSDILEGHMAV
jgi:arsenate reductase